jgi:secretion/DNA translocation related TadE-like protein
MRRACMSHSHDERGSGTLLALASALLLLGAGLCCALWAAVSTGHHRAAAAADLSAISAAQMVQSGGEDPCSTAVRIAGEQHAEILSCQVDAETVVVVAAVRLRLGALGSPSVRSTARAGPVSAGETGRLVAVGQVGGVGWAGAGS